MSTLLTITQDSYDETPARTSLPWVWFGFVFVAAFLIEVTLMVALELDESSATLLLILIALAGWIYWLFCVSRFHKILGEISRNRYPISAFEAVGRHFIPFYNLVWIFRWPNAMSDYLNRQERVKMVSGNLLGLFLLLSLLIGRFFDGSIGLAGTFLVGMYISSKLRKHLELIAPSQARLPPPPDPSLFGPSPAEDLQSSKRDPTKTSSRNSW